MNISELKWQVSEMYEHTGIYRIVCSRVDARSKGGQEHLQRKKPQKGNYIMHTEVYILDWVAVKEFELS